MNGMMQSLTTAAFLTMMVICYIIEAILLARIAANEGKEPLLAWIPVANYFLIRDIAGKKSRWQWLVGFLAAALLGSYIVSWLGLNVLLWSALIWYWAAFFKIAERKGVSIALCMFAIFFVPLKWYVMYKIAE